MKIIPAIDLINGKCVRLIKGDFAQKTVYSDDPVLVARSFEQKGSEYLHIIDLDGAKNSEMAQLATIRAISKNTNLKIQVGGGINNAKKIDSLFEIGIERVIIGSLAVKEPEKVKEWLQIYGNNKIVLALDVKITTDTPYISINGWQKTSEIKLWDILDDYTQAKHVLCTDIDKDGTLQKPNFALYKAMSKKYPHLLIQASGGVSSLDDIKELAEIGVDSAITGKALYEGKFTLEEALAC
jgi:phosphoribosylformimino-5-aminoimidazole carboxamide ribotide isomerase